MKKRIILLIVGILVFVTGCSQDSQVMKEKPNQKVSPPTQTNQQPPLKRELTAIEKQLMRSPGIYSGTNYNEAKVKAALDQLPKNLTADQYFNEFLKLVAEDYRPFVTTFVNFDTKIAITQQRPGEEIVLPPSKKLHVSILLDASGSMRAAINQKAKITSAKEAILAFASRLPKNATISLRVYGHKGTGKQQDKQLSCSSTEEIYHAVGPDPNQLQKSLAPIKPAGWTPIARALDSVKKDINPATTDSIVYVVSDGIETCGGDPVKVAKELNQSKVKTIVNIIGFDIDNDGQRLLKQVAQAGNGTFTSVDGDEALKAFLQKQYEQLEAEWKQWMEEAIKEAEKQKEVKTKLALDTRDNIYAKLDVERAHLDSAQQYLENKRGAAFPNRAIYDRIANRYGITFQYATDTGYNLWSESANNSTKARFDILDEGGKERSEITDKQNR